jgi:hypothetical protein
MSDEDTPELVKQIFTLLEPIKTRCHIAFVVIDTEKDGSPYSVFGNLPEGGNARLIRDVAIDMAVKDVMMNVVKMNAMEELKDPETKIN